MSDEKKSFTHFAEETDIHGLKQITRSENGVVSYH